MRDLPTTGPYTRKPYRCKGCGQEKEIGTNHWGECYPFCDVCRSQTVWECFEPVPKGYGKPEPWKMARLGDILDAMEPEDRKKTEAMIQKLADAKEVK